MKGTRDEMGNGDEDRQEGKKGEDEEEEEDKNKEGNEDEDEKKEKGNLLLSRKCIFKGRKDHKKERIMLKIIWTRD